MALYRCEKRGPCESNYGTVAKRNDAVVTATPTRPAKYLHKIEDVNALVEVNCTIPTIQTYIPGTTVLRWVVLHKGAASERLESKTYSDSTENFVIVKSTLCHGLIPVDLAGPSKFHRERYFQSTSAIDKDCKLSVH